MSCWVSTRAQIKTMCRRNGCLQRPWYKQTSHTPQNYVQRTAVFNRAGYVRQSRGILTCWDFWFSRQLEDFVSLFSTLYICWIAFKVLTTLHLYLRVWVGRYNNGFSVEMSLLGAIVNVFRNHYNNLLLLCTQTPVTTFNQNFNVLFITEFEHTYTNTRENTNKLIIKKERSNSWKEFCSVINRISSIS